MNTPEPDDRGLVLVCPQCGQRNRMTFERLGQKFRCGKCHTDLRPPAEPIDLKSEAVFDPLTACSALPVLVDFWAPWCGPCLGMAPQFDLAASQLKGRAVLAKLNSDDNPKTSARFGIRSIPTLVRLEGGVERSRQTGALQAGQIVSLAR